MSEIASSLAVFNGSVAAAGTALNFLEKASSRLRNLGIDLNKVANTTISVSLLEEVKTIDSNKTLEIGKTFENIEAFATIMRENTANTIVLDKHAGVVSAFDSIRTDALALQKQEEKDKLALSDKARNMWMTMSRGTIPQRFRKIEKVFKEVILDTDKALVREQMILEAYMDFRGALQASQVSAQQMLKVQAPVVEKAQANYIEAAKRASEEGINAEERAKRELVRDTAQRVFEAEERKQDVCKRISENLLISYNASESVMAALAQTHKTKRAVNDQSKIFFTTNANLFTAIETTINSQIGTREATKSLQAMTGGMNNMLEVIAEQTGKVNSAAINAAHGSTIKASSVAKLVDAVTSFQLESRRLANEARLEATKNAEEIVRITDEGKKKIAINTEIGITKHAAVSGLVKEGVIDV